MKYLDTSHWGLSVNSLISCYGVVIEILAIVCNIIVTVCVCVCVCNREEWQWLQALSSLEESLEMDQDVQSAPHRLLQDLRSAAKDLMAHMNIPVSQVSTHPSTQPSIHPEFHPSINSSIPSVHPSVHPSITANMYCRLGGMRLCQRFQRLLMGMGCL